MNPILSMAIPMVIGVAALLQAPVAQAEDMVTYEIFSDSVAGLAGVEYRDTAGKHLLQDVPLPWTLTVPVVDATSPTADGAELRADWRPNFRTAATVGRVLLGDELRHAARERGEVGVLGDEVGLRIDLDQRAELRGVVRV